MKRTAENQLTKDNFESENGDSSHANPGEGFSKAAPEVLAKRRIVKVRRTAGPKSATGAPVDNKPNPFAAVPAAPPSTTDGSGGEAKNTNVAAAATAATAATKDATENASVELETAAMEPSNSEKKVIQEELAATQTSNEEPRVESTVKNDETNAVRTANPEPETSTTKEVAPIEPIDNASEKELLKPVEETLEQNNVPKQEAPKDDAKDEPPAASPKAAAKASDAPADAAESKGEDADSKKVQADTASKVETNATISDVPKRTPFTFGGTVGSSTTPFASFADAAAAEKSKQPFSFSVPEFPPGEKPTAAASFGVGGGSAAGQKFEPAPVSSGEENEIEVFRTTKAKLYEFEAKQWKSRGEGTFKMNVPKSDGKPRLLMRREGTLQLVLNSPIFPGFKLNRTGERGVTFKNTETDKVVTVKFSSRNDAGLLEQLIEEWKEKL